MHRDHVPVVPSDFELLGSTSTSMNQGMVKFKAGSSSQLVSLSDIQILTVQGHPEYTKSIVQKMTGTRASQGIIPLELAEDVKLRSEWQNDGVTILGKTVWEVLSQS
jgi:GMP synthase-like glutamine amidotransferase